MYRLGFFSVVILAIAFGLVVGTLNPAVVTVDLMWVRFDWPLGLVLLLALAVGVSFGLLLTWLFSILPLKLQLRRLAHRREGELSIPPDA